MAQYIDKDTLVAEIEKRINGLKDCHADTVAGYNGEISGFKRLLHSIDTIEVKEVDLEKELSMYLEVVKATDEDIDFVDFAKHFFGLGILSTITEEDCKLIWNIGDSLPYMPEEDFFKELLLRFKAQKGEKV